MTTTLDALGYQQVKQMIMENRRIIIGRVADNVNILWVMLCNFFLWFRHKTGHSDVCFEIAAFRPKRLDIAKDLLNKVKDLELK